MEAATFASDSMLQADYLFTLHRIGHSNVLGDRHFLSTVTAELKGKQYC